MTPRRQQRIWPFAVAVIVGALAAYVVVLCEIGSFPFTIPAATMTFGIVVSGFVATQRNMLLTMSGAEVLRFAVRTGLHKDVLSYLMDCIGAGLFVTGLSLVGFFLSENDLLWAIWVAILTGSIALVICLIIRNEILVALIVRRFLEEQEIP